MVKRIDRWAPDAAQMALWPEVSGNAINGLGEDGFRRPRHVYWARDPDTIPHGPVQKWFYGRNTDPEMTSQRAARVAEQTRAPVPLGPRDDLRTPAQWTAAVKQQACTLGAEAVGIAAMRDDWVFEGRSVPWRSIIVLGIRMDHAAMAEAPEMPAAIEVMRQYTRGVRVAHDLVDWLRSSGIEAVPETGPMANDVSLVPAALAAGMGELGKHGSIINREMGACFRLSSVLTDLVLDADEADEFGADDFCSRCRICSDWCPPAAIAPEKQTVRGTAKWYVDFDRCLPFFNETAGCGICLAVCPFSDPDKGPSLVEKLERRRARRAG